MIVIVAQTFFGGSAWRLCSSSLAGAPFDRVLCALAGIWLPTWPLLPFFPLIIISNVLIVSASFRQPARDATDGTAWSAEDGGLACVSLLGFGAWVALELLVFGPPMIFVNGTVPLLLAYINVCLRGNRFEFITSTKSGVVA